MPNRYRMRQLVAASVVVTIWAWASAARSAEPARNVILMIADGAGFNAFEAAAYYQHGRLGRQPYDRFPVRYGCTTFMLNYVDEQGAAIAADAGKIPGGASGVLPQGYDARQTWRNFNHCKGSGDYLAFTDSAAAATALYTGTKTTRGRMATSWEGKTRLTTVAELADGVGKATGTISSVQVSHATPAAVWGHNRSREKYSEIFREMVYQSGLDVIMGAGHPLYDDNGRRLGGRSAQPDYKYVGGRQTWDDLTDGDGAAGFRFIEQKSQFQALAAGSGPDGSVPQRLLGVARVHKTLQMERHGTGMAPGVRPNAGVPSLQTMTRAALNVLAEDPDGFFLMVEGGAVDWANHDNNLARTIEELIDFNGSVRAVVEWVESHGGWEQTLLIVTSDHECGMLWGESTYVDRNANGRFDAGKDEFVDFQPVANRGKGRLPGVQYGSGGHTNTLVPLWAIGAGSARLDALADAVDTGAGKMWDFSGKLVDNTDVFTVIKAAMAAKRGSGQ